MDINTRTNDHQTLRRMSFDFNFVKQASSSSLFQLDYKTKISCAVYGPRANVKDLNEFSEKCRIVCDVKFAPFATKGERRGRGGRSAYEEEISNLLEQALTAGVCLDKYPKCVINVYIIVLEDDGNVLGAAITAASLTLIMAGVECYDLVLGISASVTNKKQNKDTTTSNAKNDNNQHQQLILDSNAEEEENATGSMIVAYMPNLEKVNVWHVVGKMDGKNAADGLNACINKCNEIHLFAKQTLENHSQYQLTS
jgi:exosome complex component MTR3